MPRKANGKSDGIVPGGVDEYIAKYPAEVQTRLAEIRLAIQAAAPDATETVSYFEMPGYFYAGYDYNGMFAWFSFKKPYVRLHVRPPVLEDDMKDLGDYACTKAIVSFPADKAIPKALVKKLVKASIKVMKEKRESPEPRLTGSSMSKHRIFTMEFSKVYPLYVQKAQRKNRAREDVDRIICWLTGYSQQGLQKQIEERSDFETFFAQAPAIHPNSSLIKGVVCGVRVEDVEDPLMQKIRYLDKLIDELAKGKTMEKILR